MATAAAAVVSWVATAVASTVSVAAAAVGFTGVAAGWTVVAAYYATEIALYAGLSYAIDAVQRPKAKPVGSELTFNIDPDYPREMVVGERLIGGSMVARYSKGPDRSQAHLVIQVADHPCEALLEAYGDSRLVRNSPLTHGVRTEITAYSNSGGPRVWMTWHDGRPGQTADADLVSASAQDPEVIAGRMPAWTSDHKGAGCAYVHVEVRHDSDILTNIPSFLFKVRGAKFYDRRLDTTAGGSGAHRIDDPSTWAYTTNAAVVWDHYSLGYKVEDDDFAFGIGLSKTELPYAQFEQAADLADEDVLTGTGGSTETIKRYVINGVLSAATFFQDQLEDFQIQMAGRIVDLGGRIGLIGAEEKVSAVSLSAGDLVAGEPFQFAPKLQFSDLYGQVSGTFADPANNYQGTPYVSQKSQYALLPDGGEAQSVTMDLPLEIHPRRAVRNVSAWLARESLQPRMVGVFMPKAWKLEVGDWFDYTDAGLQVEAAMFEVIDILKNEDFTVTITARAVNPDFLAFDNDNDPGLSVPPDVAPVDLLLTTPAFTVTPVESTGGGVTEPVIEVELGDLGPLAREILIEIREWDPVEEEFVGASIYFVAHSDDFTSILRQGLKPGTVYKVRTKARAGVRESPWSEWSDPVTTSPTFNVPSATTAEISDTIADGAITTASFAAGITPVEIVATLPVTGNFLGRTVFLTSDNKLYRYGGSGFTAVTAAADITGQVTGSQIADAAITAAKAASGVAFVEIVATLPVSGNYEGRTVYLTTDDKWYRHDGTSFVSTTAAADISGQLISTQLQDAAVVAAKIADGAVTVNKLAARSITAAKLALVDLENMLTEPAITDSVVWSIAGGAAFSASSEITTNLNAPSGVAFNGAGQTSAAVGAAGLQSNYRPRVEGGKNYRLFMRRRVMTGFTGRFRVAVRWYDISMAQIGSTISIVIDTDYRTVAAAADANTTIEGQATAPSNAVYANFYTQVEWSATLTNAGTLYAADPKMNRAQSAELLVDGAVTAVKIGAQSITASKVALVDFENLLTDPLFGDTVDIWAMIGGAGASGSVNITAQLNASRGVVFTGAGQTSALNGEASVNATYYARAEGGKAYRLSFRRRVVTGFTGRLSLVVRWYDQAKTIIGSAVTVATDTDYRTVATASTANGALDAQVTAPSNAAFVQFATVCEWSATLTNASAAYIADPKLNRAQGAELIVDGAVIAAKIAAGAVTANAIAAQAITASKLAIVDLENLVADPLMTDSANIWGLSGGAVLSINSQITSNLNSPSGVNFSGPGQTSAAAGIAWTNANYFARVEGGKVYRFSVRRRVATGFTGQLLLCAQWFDQSKTIIGSTAIVATDTDYRTVAAASSSTALLDAQATAPSNAAYVRYLLQVNWSATLTNAGNLYVADPKLSRAMSGELIVDGAITAGKIAALAVTAGKIDAGAVTATELAAGSVVAGKVAAGAIGATEIAARAIVASKLAITDIENLLTDPLITDTTNIWSMTFGAAASTSAEITANLNSPSGGVFPGAGQTSANNSNIGIQSNYYARVEGGKSYRFSIRTRRKAGFTGWFLAGCDWYDQSKTLISSALFGALSDYRTVAAASDATQVIDGQIAAPANAAYVKFNVGVLWSSTLTNAGSLYIADPKMNRAMSGELIVDGAVTAAKISVTSLDAITATIGLLRTATTGARMELESNQQRIYDSSGNLRVRIGVW